MEGDCVGFGVLFVISLGYLVFLLCTVLFQFYGGFFVWLFVSTCGSVKIALKKLQVFSKTKTGQS